MFNCNGVIMENENKEYISIDELRLSYFKAYVLCFFFGWLGIHRLYLKKWFTGFVYAFTFGLFGMGWMADFFLIPFMVKGANVKAEEGKLVLVSKPVLDDTPSWVTEETLEQTFFSVLEFPLQILFFMFAPIIFVLLAAVLKRPELAVILVFLLLVGVFLRSMLRAIKEYEELERVPVIGEVLKTLIKLHEFYSQNKPRSFVFYILYPIIGPFAMLFSSSVRKEFWLHLKAFGPIALIIFVQTGFEYLFIPHLTWTELAMHALLMIILINIMIIFVLIPVVTTSFSLNLAGKKFRLGLLMALALLFTIPFGIGAFGYTYGYLGNDYQTISLLSNEILKDRMKKEKFMTLFHEANDMFLSYYHPQNSKKEVTVDLKLTKKYRDHIAGIAIGDQNNAFSVIVFEVLTGGSSQTWYGVRYENEKVLLYLYNVRTKVFYHSWSDLPKNVRAKFMLEKERKEKSKISLTDPQIIRKKSL